MAGSERFAAIIEAQTRGTAEVQKLEEALTRLMNTADKSGKKSSEAIKKSTDEMRGSIDGLKNILSNPFGAASESAEKFVLSFGKVGAVMAGSAAVIGAAAGAAFLLAKRTGELAEQQSNAATILGLSIKDYGLFSQAAENAGVSADLLTGVMRGLSKSLSDQDDEGKKAKRALDQIGVSSVDAFGKVRPTKDLLLGIADALGKIENPAQRADNAIKILGRGGIGLIPILNKELRGSLTELEKMGVGFDEFSANTALNFDNALDRMTTRLKTFFKDVGVQIAAASGFEDPNKTKADADQRARERANNFELAEANRTGARLAIDPRDLLSATSAARNIAAVSDDQLLSQQKQSAKTKITALIENKDAQSKLAAAQKDLADAIADANVEAVRRLQIQIRGLEQQAKLEAELKSHLEKNNSPFIFLPDKVGPNLRGVNRKYSGLSNDDLFRMFPGNLPEDYFTDNSLPSRPSLSTNRERILRAGGIGGTFTIDQKAYDTANAGTQSAAAEQASARAAGIEGRRTTDLARNLAITRQTADLDIQRFELLAREGEQGKLINETMLRRLQMLNEEASLGGNLRDIEVERVRVVREAELQILQIKKQQREEGRNTATSLFDAAVSGGQGLRSFITSQALSIPRTIAGNLGAEMGGLTGKLSLGLGGLPGRLLAGTPFGADPLKAAGDVQMTAAQIQLQAAQLNAGSAGTAGIGGSLGSIFGGATSSPMIFNSLPSSWGTRNLDIISMTSGIPLNTGGPKMSGMTRGIGIAGLLGAGAFGAYSGFSAGGAQGALTGTSSLAGAAAGLLPLMGVTGPAAPIIGAVALGLGLTAAILGDPKKKRANALSAEADSRQFTEPTGAAYGSDIYGRQYDYDYRGGMRVVNNYFYTSVDAVDAPSFDNLLERSAVKVAQTVTGAVSGGNADDLVGVMRQAM